MITRVSKFLFYTFLTGFCMWSAIEYSKDATKALRKIN